MKTAFEYTKRLVRHVRTMRRLDKDENKIQLTCRNYIYYKRSKHLLNQRNKNNWLKDVNWAKPKSHGKHKNQGLDLSKEVA